jgi:hypothetical protein
MSKDTPKPPQDETPIDHFGHEIEELEKSGGMGSVLRWVFILVLVAAGVAAIYLTSSSGAKRAPVSPGGTGSNVIETFEPRGRLTEAPTRFRWESISGRKSYLFSLSASGASIPLFQRVTRESAIDLTEEEKSHIRRGGTYHWEVKALDGKGASIAVGRSFFDF